MGWDPTNRSPSPRPPAAEVMLAFVLPTSVTSGTWLRCGAAEARRGSAAATGTAKTSASMGMEARAEAFQGALE
jgi:hypothetical protein